MRGINCNLIERTNQATATFRTVESQICGSFVHKACIRGFSSAYGQPEASACRLFAKHVDGLPRTFGAWSRWPIYLLYLHPRCLHLNSEMGRVSGLAIGCLLEKIISNDFEHEQNVQPVSQACTNTLHRQAQALYPQIVVERKARWRPPR